MTEGFQIVSNRCDRSACDIRFLNQQVADKATAFHSSFPQYRPTPLRRLQALGLNEGTSIRVLNRKRRGALILYVRGTRLAVGKHISAHIEVDPEEDER